MSRVLTVLCIIALSLAASVAEARALLSRFCPQAMISLVASLSPFYSLPIDFTLTSRDPVIEEHGLIKKKGYSVTPSEFIVSVREQLEDRPGLKGRIHNAIAFHGSSSASLLFLNFPGEGLIPTGELMAKGRVPYGGFNDVGVSELGVNAASISAVYLPAIRTAISYGKNPAPWNPEIGAKQIAEDQEDLKATEHESYAWFMATGRILLNQKRIENWNSLTEREKDWIEHPWSVVYGVRLKRKGSYSFGFNTVGHEISLKNGVRPDEIKVIFVPEEKISEVVNLLAEKGLKEIYVEPMEAMSTEPDRRFLKFP